MLYINDGVEYKLIPVTWRGTLMEGYLICKKTAQIFSYKDKRKFPKPLTMRRKGKTKYPSITFSIDGEPYKAPLHQVIAENLLPFPRPEGITKKVWDSTCQTVKDLIKLLYIVNHKDHDKYNWSVENLEWTTSAGNSDAYLKHIGKR